MPITLGVTLLFVLAVAVATVPLAGGHLMRLADVQFRAPWLVIVAIGVQILIISVVPDLAPSAFRAIHLLTYGLAAAFVVVNRRLPGLIIVGIGGALNLLAIGANGGVMPASAEATRAAGLTLEPGEFENSAPVDGARLQFLGDIWATPSFLPVDNVFSVGDVVITLGVFVGLHRICGSRLVPRRARRPSLAPYRASGSSGTGVSPE